MNIFEAAREAFPQGKGICQACFPGNMVVVDPDRPFCGVLSDEGVLYEGWNPTPEELMADDWELVDMVVIRRTERPETDKTARACGFEDDDMDRWNK